MKIYQHWYHPDINITVLDIVVILLIYFAANIFSRYTKRNKAANKPAYNYFPNALNIRITMSIVFALVVMFFYPGDSMVYFQNLNCFNKLFFIDSHKYFDILLNGNQPEYWSYFTIKTGYPASYMWKDSNAILVSRLFSPVALLTYRSYILTTIIAGFIGFSGIWRLYLLFCDLYPGLEKKFTYGIIYFPSTIFWSSGIMKDTLTLSAIGWIMYSFYYLAIIRKIKIKYFIAIAIGVLMLINIKAYIFAALLPGLLIWFFFGQLKSIKSGFVKFFIAPLLLVITALGFLFIMSGLSGLMGVYGDLNKSIEQAQIIQHDLTRAEQYGENYYDIGEFDASPEGLLSKAPIAIISGIFRPFIWEATNPFILLAGLESLFLMCYLLYCFFKQRFKLFKSIFSDPMLIFAFCFIVLFGFGVGLATANFGALVRYKIPILPFFISSLLILTQKHTVMKDVKS